MDSHSIFDKIIYIGPDIRMLGGIASVLRSYRDMIHPFHFIAVNSHRGRLVGYFSLLALFARLPFARLKGRKVVHIHYASGKSWIRESKIMGWARFWGYKTIMHCHAGLFPAYANKHPEVKNTLKRSDVNVVLSPKWIEIFRNHIGIDGTVSINNVIKPSTVKKASNTDGPVVFTFIGDIIERKGIFDLIDAVDILPHDADFRIEICGRGETERLQRRIASSPHTEKINFHGAVSPDQRDFILSRTSVVVLPSYAEGVPMAILEGMAAGTGIIATDVGGTTDVVTENKNGFIIKPGDTEALAAVIKRYIDNPALVTEHTAVSSERIKAFYPDAVRNSLISLYSSL